MRSSEASKQRPDKKQLEIRRQLVLKNMCELMQSIGRGDEFADPDAWLDSIIERPRPAKPQS
jgi:hypothetical protein